MIVAVAHLHYAGCDVATVRMWSIASTSTWTTRVEAVNSANLRMAACVAATRTAGLPVAGCWTIALLNTTKISWMTHGKLMLNLLMTHGKMMFNLHLHLLPIEVAAHVDSISRKVHPVDNFSRRVHHHHPSLLKPRLRYSKNKWLHCMMTFVASAEPFTDSRKLFVATVLTLMPFNLSPVLNWTNWNCKIPDSNWTCCYSRP